MFFYLYETKDGKRKEERKATNGFNDEVKHIINYYKIIYPWLQGRYDKDIPTYWQIIKEKRADDIKQMYKRFFNK